MSDFQKHLSESMKDPEFENEYEKLIGDIGDILIAHPSESVSKLFLRKAIKAIERLLTEREAAELKRQSEIKLKAIKDLCMSVPDCGVCLLSIGKTCPIKFWHDWTPEEIETAFNIIYGGEVDDARNNIVARRLP